MPIECTFGKRLTTICTGFIRVNTGTFFLELLAINDRSPHRGMGIYFTVPLPMLVPLGTFY